MLRDDVSTRLRLQAPRLLLASMLALILSGCVSTTERQERRQQLAIERGAAVLSVRTDADSLAAAGVLQLERQPQTALALIARATNAGSERPDLFWLQAQTCQSTKACDPEPAAARLRQLDPANGASWIISLTRADAVNDAVARDTALKAIGESQRIDIYWTTLVSRLSSAASHDTRTSLPVALTAVMGEIAAVGIPTYSPLSKACASERLAVDQTLETCRALSRALLHGDTYITEMFGIAIAKRVWAADSTEWQAAGEASRRYNYVSEKSRHIDETHTAAGAARFVSMLAQNRREQDFSRARLIASGMNPDPPAP